jgi:hypothetical protein
VREDVSAGTAGVRTRARAGATWFKPFGYVLIVALAATVAFTYRVRLQGLFTCPASGYALGYFVAYCHGETFGDYDHGAFWYDLEPEARYAAVGADVLLLGSSRMQFAFSSAATSSWFQSRSLRHYLLGFGYTENVAFVTPLLKRLTPRARAYVINVDRFFSAGETPPAGEILHGGETARKKYEDKRRWLQLHRRLCGSLPFMCGDSFAYLRRASDGHWRLDGRSQGDSRLIPGPTSEGPEGDRNRWPAFVNLATQFVSELPVNRRCVFLTLVPYQGTRRAEAAAIAAALGLDLIQPPVTDLQTFDGSHLDEPSAERWSAAFFETAGAGIHQCTR